MIKTYAPTFIVEIGGQELPEDISAHIESFTYEESEKQMDELRLTITKGDLSYVDNPLLQEGKEIRVRWGYVGNLSEVRTCTIKEIDYSFSEDGLIRMEITAYDKRHKLTGRASRQCWKDKKLSEIVKDIAQKHNTDNNDPKKLGRLKIRIQSAYGDQPVDNLPWAWPCFGYGGAEGMCMFAVPEIGAGVWVMFQNKDGEPDTTYPVWLGVWQAEKEAPEEVTGEAKDAHYYKEIKTTSGHNVVFCDKPDEEFIEIKDKDGNFMRMDDKNETVEIRDKNGSYILMKDGNIDIHAEGNMKLTASRIDLN